MRAVLVGAAALLLAVAAWAAPVWTEAGWYQVADTFVGYFVLKGPFADEASCRQTLPPDEEDADYVCEFLNERPSWDQ